MAEISILTAIFAGSLSFLSPCVLPLVPPYLCYMAGVSIDDFRLRRHSHVKHENSSFRRMIMLASLFFTLGFSTVFILLGASASTLGGLLRSHLDVLSQIGGVIIILMGLHFSGVFRFAILTREFRFHGPRRNTEKSTQNHTRNHKKNHAAQPATLSGAYLMGLAFAFGWTPCIGPVLGTILGIAASRETLGAGAFLLGAYSLGLAIPFWIAATFSGQFMVFLTRFRHHLGLVEKLMGILLIVTGILFLTGSITMIGFWILETFPNLGAIG